MDSLSEERLQWYVQLGLYETIVIFDQYWLEIDYDEQLAFKYFDWFTLL